MAEIPREIAKIIRNFLIEAENDNIHISKAYLFGSYAKGNQNIYSDIDLALVSDDFEGIFFYDNQKIRRAKLKASIDLETHTYRPEQFTEYNPFVNEILSTGIQIL